MPIEDYEEFYDEDEVKRMTHDSYMEQRRSERRRTRQKKQTDVLNEVGIVPDTTPEIEERRQYYCDH